MNTMKYETLMRIAREVSTLSTCQFTSVGCVIVTSEFKPVSFGYNGTASGDVHCSDVPMERSEHLDFSDKNEIHAEMNAILQADRSLLKGSTLFTTVSPCYNCLKHIVASGVKTIVCGSIYHRYTDADIIDMSLYAEKHGVAMYLCDDTTHKLYAL